ncbi:MAG: tRNA pseudouridine(55) synthase TruB [Ruminococcaceae bacterium]|nr:tRNA pseudouridine(55) synthase TruB [Oscillospiraceae bacterium]
MQGLLLINKPEGITSFKAVSCIKKCANTKKVGHTGTLDPLATGVLPLLVGRATSLCPYLLNADKRYIATVKLGIITDTLDITGNVLSEAVPSVSRERLEEAINNFIGAQLQIPPAYSAIKKDGVPLYKLARAGKEIDIPAREVTVHSIKLLEFEDNISFKIDVLCSKGTYIRSLCRDIGDYLSCGATMTALTRTATGGFTLENCTDLDQITADNIEQVLLDEEMAVSHLPILSVTEKQGIRFSNGGKLSFDRLNTEISDGYHYRVKVKDRFIGIGYADEENREIRIKCLINPIF